RRAVEIALSVGDETIGVSAVTAGEGMKHGLFAARVQFEDHARAGAGHIGRAIEIACSVDDQVTPRPTAVALSLESVQHMLFSVRADLENRAAAISLAGRAAA